MGAYKQLGLLTAARIAAEEKALRRDDAAFRLANGGELDASLFSEWEERGIRGAAETLRRQGCEDAAYNAVLATLARGVADEDALRAAAEGAGCNPRRVWVIVGAALQGRALRGNPRRMTPETARKKGLVSTIPAPLPTGKAGVVKRAKLQPPLAPYAVRA